MPSTTRLVDTIGITTERHKELIVICLTLADGCDAAKKATDCSECLLLTNLQFASSRYRCRRLMVQNGLPVLDHVIEETVTGRGQLIRRREDDFMVVERWDL